MPMWSVYVSFETPRWPAGVQRVAGKCGITVSVRAPDEAAALVKGGACARRKGCRRPRGMWAVKMEVVR